jgi:hypothetical protein
MSEPKPPKDGYVVAGKYRGKADGPLSDSEKRMIALRNAGAGKIGDTPLSDAGLLIKGKDIKAPKYYKTKPNPNQTYVESIQPKRVLAPGMWNADTSRPVQSKIIKARNRTSDAYAASLPGAVAARKSATVNALAMAKARKKGGK